MREYIGKSPSKQKYTWVAEYGKSITSEFDFDTGKENSFYDIDKSKVKRFGLVGDTDAVWVENYGGTLIVNGSRYDINYREAGVVYPLTGSGIYYRDIITYKKAVSDANMDGTFTTNIVGFYIGFKEEVSFGEESFNVKIILDVTNGVIDLHVVSDKDRDGYIEFIKNGDRIAYYDASLNKGVGGGMVWKVR